jgi:hypothetical protein
MRPFSNEKSKLDIGVNEKEQVDVTVYALFGVYFSQFQK